MAPTSWRRKTGCCQEVCRDQESMSRQEVCRDQCRDKQYVATSVATKQAVATSVATKQAVATSVVTSSMSRPVSRQAVCLDQCRDQASCRDQCRDKQYVATSVATRRLCRDQKALSRPETLRNPKKSQKLIF